jgi:Spy/CpxP family protein refolding chaperone
MRLLELSRNMAIIVCIGAGAGAGCGASSAPPSVSATALTSAPAGAQAGEDEEGDKLVEHHRHHHGGVAMFLSMSLDSLGVSDEQRAGVEKIQEELSAKLEPAHAAQQSVLSLLADGVATGAVDRPRVDAAIATVDASSTATQAATDDALNQLHALLTPPERAALAQKMEAHWDVWQQANAEDELQGSAHEHGPLARLTRELSLTPDQAERIRASLRASAQEATATRLDPAEMSSRLKSLGTAFQADTFDAKAVTSGQVASGHLATHGLRRMARLYEAATPVLTLEQRAKLAERLRDHARQEAGK